MAVELEAMVLSAEDADDEAVLAGLGQFPETARRIVLMRHREKLGFDAIAGLVELDVEDVRTIWFYSLEALAELLQISP